jgi:hypothetical protein
MPSSLTLGGLVGSTFLKGWAALRGQRAKFEANRVGPKVALGLASSYRGLPSRERR